MATAIVNGARVHGTGPVMLGRIQEEPGNGVETNRDSVSTAERVFTGLFTDLVNQTPKINDEHPDFPALLVTRKRIAPTKGGRGKATITYEGPDPSLGDGQQYDPITNPENNITEPTVEIDTETVEEPIEAHPNFAGLVAAAGTGPGQATYDDDGLFLGFGPKSNGGLAGVQSYLRRLTVTTQTTLSRQRLNPNEVATTEGSNLVTKVTSSKTGNVWKNTKQTKSGPWNPIIYA